VGKPKVYRIPHHPPACSAIDNPILQLHPLASDVIDDSEEYNVSLFWQMDHGIPSLTLKG
jgi:hypothetical protein